MVLETRLVYGTVFVLEWAVLRHALLSLLVILAVRYIGIYGGRWDYPAGHFQRLLWFF